MKKAISFITVLALALTTFSGCSGSQATDTIRTDQDTAVTAETESDTEDSAKDQTTESDTQDANKDPASDSDEQNPGKDTKSDSDADKDQAAESDAKNPDKDQDTEADSQNPDSSQSKTVDVPPGMTDEMLERSILYRGDTSRLAAKLKKASEDKEASFNVVFLGDSITAGSTTSRQDFAYVNRVKTWCQNNISRNTEVTNSGIGATNSYFGVHRLERDVFAYSPDVIFVEFINDSGNQFYKTTMESLLRRCLAYENDPAVILIEMSLDGGGNAQEQHVPLAEKYGVPVLSYHEAITPEIAEGNLSFRTSDSDPANTDGLSPDGTHPNDRGHLMVFQMITNFLGETLENADSAGEVIPFDSTSDSITGDVYKNAKMSDRSTDDLTITASEGFDDPSSAWGFPNGWSASQSGATITFKMEFQNLGMLYYRTNDGKSGILHVEIDGKDIRDVNGDFPGGWGSYPADAELYRSDAPAEHTVTVTVKDDDTRHGFQLLGWLIS